MMPLLMGRPAARATSMRGRTPQARTSMFAAGDGDAVDRRHERLAARREDGRVVAVHVPIAAAAVGLDELARRVEPRDGDAAAQPDAVRLEPGGVLRDDVVGGGAAEDLRQE